MRFFISELKYLAELYERLKTEFSGPSLEGSTGASTLAESILRNRELLARIEQMNGRLGQLAGEWATFREHLEPDARSEVSTLAEAVRNQAQELSRICEERIQQLQRGRNDLQAGLDGVQTGARYLATIKPVKTNYPKFLDSLG